MRLFARAVNSVLKNNMSRHSFSSIVKNKTELVFKYDLENGESEISEPRDLEGVRLTEWFDDAVVGWDEPLQTYFVQCKEVGDDLVWWFGTDFNEIRSFNELCSIINRIFFNEVDFEFIDDIVRA